MICTPLVPSNHSRGIRPVFPVGHRHPSWIPPSSEARFQNPGNCRGFSGRMAGSMGSPGNLSRTHGGGQVFREQGRHRHITVCPRSELGAWPPAPWPNAWPKPVTYSDWTCISSALSSNVSGRPFSGGGSGEVVRDATAKKADRIPGVPS